MRCFFCTCRMPAEREAKSNVCLRCSEQELARLYPHKIPRVRRCWEGHSVEAQTVRASGSLQYRAPRGHYFYVRDDMPGKAFRSRQLALMASES